MKYEFLDERHPDYDPDYWKVLRAWYEGGKKLLRDETILESVFPCHGEEEHEVYEERKKRAQYVPYPGQIIDRLVGAFQTREVRMVDGPEDEFWKEFFADCSAPGGRKNPFAALVTEGVREALICKWAWALVDLPRPTVSPGATLDEQEKAGDREAYVCLLPAECVDNWEEDEAGEILYAKIRMSSDTWHGIGTKRGEKVETFVFWTKNTWQSWSITWKDGKKPLPDAEATETGKGNHTFGRVPLARIELPAGLWAMNKVESVIRAWFNKRNALDWSQYKNLLPILYATIGASEIDPGGEEAGQRLLNQRGGPGKLLLLGEKDTLAYAQPDSGNYAAYLDDLKDARDEMHRVLHSMADAVDDSGAALRRSAESKSIDKESTAIILAALGKEAREFAEQICDLASRGRGDEPDAWQATGADDYDSDTTEDLVNQSIMLETVVIPSPTFQKKIKLRLCKSILGKEATEEDITAIEAELETNVTDESVLPEPPTVPGQPDAPGQPKSK